jgi:hypothetical protein
MKRKTNSELSLKIKCLPLSWKFYNLLVYRAGG